MRPQLPEAGEILDYLHAIDGARWYTNFGPLLRAFERRLAEYWGVPEGALVAVANATSGLALALKAAGAPSGTLCAMPAWTFPATPAAALVAGWTPWFVDVDETTWALDPARLKALLAQAPARVGAVVPVSDFSHQPMAYRLADAHSRPSQHFGRARLTLQSVVVLHKR